LDPGADRALVTLDNPAFATPGMIRVRVDMEGRLLSFEARPAESNPPEAAAAPDWKPLFELAHLDSARFQAAAPQWTPGMAFDAIAAWTGAWPEAPEIPIRIEAAAWRGKPVSFRIIQPWVRPAGSGGGATGELGQFFWTITAWFVIFPLGCWIAMKNVRQKRGDTRGAVRLGILLFLAYGVSDLFMITHMAAPRESNRIFEHLSMDLAQGVFVGIAYLALEPFVRRRCPRLLISWTRLLQGGWRDPLVGSDVLKGVALGAVLGIVVLLEDVLYLRASVVPGPSDIIERALLGARQLAGDILGQATFYLWASLILLFIFFLGRLAFRRDYAGGVLVVLFGLSDLLFPWPSMGIHMAINLVAWGALGWVLVRLGFLSMVVMVTSVAIGTFIVPSTLDPSRWYFVYSLSIKLAVLAFAVGACRIAMGGRSALSDETIG
jgi:hypothetical protein